MYRTLTVLGIVLAVAAWQYGKRPTLTIPPVVAETPAPSVPEGEWIAGTDARETIDLSTGFMAVPADRELPSVEAVLASGSRAETLPMPREQK